MEKKRTGPFLCVLAIAFAPRAEALAAQGAAAAPGATYTSATECAKCHQAIHLYWSESEHAKAATKASFLESLRAATTARPAADTRQRCVSCHAPTAMVSGDYALEKPTTREGVSCDFCHTVSGVDLSKRDPFDLAPGPVKRGPLEYATSPFHQTAYSPLHKSSVLLCAGCHEHENARGVKVLSTYSEWKAGPYAAQGQTCQECHMPLVPGRSVKEGLDSTQRRINLHRMSGGSLANQVASGLKLRIDSADIGGATALVQVAVVNSGVGHAAPGGLSSKSLVLTIGVETASGKLVSPLQKVYRRVLRNERGQEVATVAEAFFDAASVGEDTRLQPRETRSERFTLPLPADWRAIVAKLEYQDASDPRNAPVVTRVAEERRERGR